MHVQDGPCGHFTEQRQAGRPVVVTVVKAIAPIVYEFVGGEHFALPMTQYVWRHAAVVIQPLAGTWPRRLRARERRQPAVGPGARTWLTSSGQQVHRRSGPPGIRRAVTAHARLPGISRTANILAQPIAWPSAERSSPRGAWSRGQVGGDFAHGAGHFTLLECPDRSEGDPGSAADVVN